MALDRMTDAEAEIYQAGVADAIRSFTTERDRLKAEVAELVGALDDLMAEQNGPPLCDPRHEKAWQRAMDNATAVLARVRGDTQEQP